MAMKELDTLTVTKVGQGTLPKWWRDAAGLQNGGVVEVRPVRDRRNSIILTPRVKKKAGAKGLLSAFGSCPFPLPAPRRHTLPAK